VKNANFLVPVNVLRRSFRAEFRKQLEAIAVRADPVVWSKDWGVHIQPFGNGSAAIKYLGAYVSRTAIGDKRILAINHNSVDIAWRDRADHGKIKSLTLEGSEFVERYLRHVLPCGMRAVRYYGYCHPAANKTRERVALHTGMTLFVGAVPMLESPDEPSPQRCCKCCGKAMEHRGVIVPGWRSPARPLPQSPTRPPPVQNNAPLIP